jgi:iron(III) transport system substrate-binding protein
MLVGLWLAACRVEWGVREPTETTDGSPTGEVWIYTSIYQPVVDAIDPQIRARFPGLDPKWYQAGSEKVAQRIEAEWDAGGSKACLVLTSDPFWYVDAAGDGRFASHLPPNVLHMDRSLLDADGRWTVSRISLVVLARNRDLVPETDAPRRIADLADPKWRDRASMPDPLASGTAFTSLAFLLEDGGWDGFDALRRNGFVAAGGNSAVLSRIETGERPVGMILLENLLAAADKGSPAVPIFPEDGAIAVPGPIALTAGVGP